MLDSHDGAIFLKSLTTWHNLNKIEMNGKGKEILSAEFKTYSIKYIKVLQNIKILF